jgi:hypothetical protein
LLTQQTKLSPQSDIFLPKKDVDYGRNIRQFHHQILPDGGLSLCAFKEKVKTPKNNHNLLINLIFKLFKKLSEIISLRFHNF